SPLGRGTGGEELGPGEYRARGLQPLFVDSQRPRRGRITQPRVAAQPRTLGSNVAYIQSTLKGLNKRPVMQPLQGCEKWGVAGPQGAPLRGDPGLRSATPSGWRSGNTA